MPKITVHGGPSIAGVPIASARHSDDTGEPVAVSEAAPEVVSPLEVVAVEAVSVDGVDQEPGVAGETFGGDFKPLPEAVEGDTTEQVSEPDYESWTVKQLQAVLAERELPTSGTKTELITRLRTHDEP